MLSTSPEKNTPRDFALQLGSLIALYVSVGALVALLFGVITLAIPDAADSDWQHRAAHESIRFAIAILVIVFPVYLWLTRIVNKIRRANDMVYLGLTKWLIYLSLLAGGAILLGDAVAVIYSFLNGDLTVRFLLKAIVLAVVVAVAFYYYLKDAKGYWQTHEQQSIYYGLGTLLFVAAAVIYGFTFIDLPTDVREQTIDQEQVYDLQDIQYAVESFYRREQALPADLETLYGDLSAPVAPGERAAYRYEIVTDTEYMLCASFHSESADRDAHSWGIDHNYNWHHGEGEWCFDRYVEKFEAR